MLVCSISLRAPRAGIAAVIAEAATALDAPGTGNVVFAALVDDPASVRDTVDAFVGQIMLEAANATDTTSTASVLAGAVVEAASAATAQDATVIGAAIYSSAMLPDVYVNSDGTLREANAAGVMVNL